MSFVLRTRIQAGRTQRNGQWKRVSIPIHNDPLHLSFISKNPDNLSTLSISYAYYIYIYTYIRTYLYTTHIYIYTYTIYIYTLFIYIHDYVHIFLYPLAMSHCCFEKPVRAVPSKPRPTDPPEVTRFFQGASMALCWNRCLENIFQSYGLMFCDLCLCKWIVFLFFLAFEVYIYILYIYIYFIVIFLDF